MEKILGRGAEAVLYLKNGKVIKKRIKKGYRVLELDVSIRKGTTRREHRLLTRASKLINVPKVISVDEDNTLLTMEHVKGVMVRDMLDGANDAKRIKLCKQLGGDIAKLHDNSIIHGDLTTSNFILSGSKIYFLDFGLGFVSEKIEDKAVDLHLLKQALDSRHSRSAKECFRAVLRGYKKSRAYKDVIKRLEVVEKRGRYKKKVC